MSGEPIGSNMRVGSADSGFAREELMAWCEANGVHFVLGLAKNDRLIATIEGASRRTGKPA